MESYPDNFETGSWIVRQTVRRPRARFFTLLSGLWLIIAVGASFPFWHGWPEAFSSLDWFCSLLIVFELVFVVVAIVLRFTEQPRIMREQHRNLEYLRKVY